MINLNPFEAQPAVANAPLLEVRGLATQFFLSERIGRAVDHVSFTLDKGETLGIVGESGCGKSIMALSILRLLPKPFARIVAGQILFKGRDLVATDAHAMRQVRGREISMVLQDPMTALNPVLTIGNQITEAIRVHETLGQQQLEDRAIEMLTMLRVPAAAERLKAYPHELSGGMRQRVVGAIALAGKPDLLIADEPTTALDVTVQDQYLRVLKRVQRERGLAVIFITHDLSVMARVADRIGVMYAGKIVETAPTAKLLKNARHPYTQALLRSDLSIAANRDGSLYTIEGKPPSIFEVQRGCPFAPRCSRVMDKCHDNIPPTVPVGLNHEAACWNLI
jgi:oligopeptide/dipeptide ABC transporter ATP-binding protein